MSDHLALANAVEDASIERGKAGRGVASVIFDATLLFVALHYWPLYG